MLNDRTTPLTLLRTRRSGKPRDMIAPGPDAQQLRDMVAIAARTPDHGKLAPWRFVLIEGEDRAAFRDVLETAFRAEKEEPGRLDLEAIHRFAHQAPCLLVVLSSPQDNGKIPLWEQQLSCGAVCMNLLHAAHAMGFTGSWITGWPAYSAIVHAAFARGAEKIAGFLYFGSPGFPLEDRPRPAVDFVMSRWSPTPGSPPT